jgi:hypothetical protein
VTGSRDIRLLSPSVARQLAASPFVLNTRSGLAAFPPAQTFASFVDIAILRFLLFAFMKAFQDRPAPCYQRGSSSTNRCGEIGVILLHDVKRCFLGELRWCFASNPCMAASCSSVTRRSQKPA